MTLPDKTPGNPPPAWKTAAAMIALIAAGTTASLFTWIYTTSLPSATIVLATAFGLALYVYYRHRDPAPEDPAEEPPPKPPSPTDGTIKPY